MTKHALITGGSAGLGFEVAKGLILDGWSVTITARGEDRLRQAAGHLCRLSEEARVEILPLDLSSLADIRRATERLQQSGARFDAILGNAGAKIESPMKTTEDDFEWHMGVNHLGHYALVSMALPLLSSGARISMVSSVVARRGDARGIYASKDVSLSAGQAYANSKLANQMFALELNRRLAASGSTVSATAAHPGFARASAYGSKVVRFGEYLAAQSASRGAKPILESLIAEPGSYLGPGVFELWGSPTAALVHEAALDERLCADLIHESERLTGLELDL